MTRLHLPALPIFDDEEEEAEQKVGSETSLNGRKPPLTFSLSYSITDGDESKPLLGLLAFVATRLLFLVPSPFRQNQLFLIILDQVSERRKISILEILSHVSADVSP